ncbi:hypothetical protein [Trebonia sp.]|uniref:hypothetical protein n=1 Tax=Trebonia sp. TaxID=2767075 RepID=UPI00262970A2|nr:hypothetical protein [Trebonia sp.]
MIKRTFLVFASLALAFATGACGSGGSGGSGDGISISPSTAPPGYPCTEISEPGANIGCYYFVSNGIAVACQTNLSGGNFCTNTNGNYYNYDFGETAICKNAGCTNTAIVTAPYAANCPVKIVYNNLVNDGEAWRVVNQEQDQNSTQQPITTQFISTSATTVSTNFAGSVSVNVGGSLNEVFATIYANVHAQINASVSKTASTVVGNEVTVTIPPGKTAYGIYGVKVQVTGGRLSQSDPCGGPDNNNYGEVQTYVPLSPGWCVWVSGETPCRVVQGS